MPQSPQNQSEDFNDLVDKIIANIGDRKVITVFITKEVKKEDEFSVTNFRPFLYVLFVQPVGHPAEVLYSSDSRSNIVAVRNAVENKLFDRL